MPEGRRSRLGILGGTLDPIHLGHLETAKAAQRALDLDDIVVMPARIPPHRASGPAASTYHRFAMACLAVQDLQSATVRDDELQADGPSYTALTLERLAAQCPSTELFFITGADAFAEIESWFRYPEVLNLAHFIVVSRPGVPASGVPELLPHLRSRMHRPRRTGEPWRNPSVFLVDEPTPAVSSTDIRRRRHTGESITGLVPAAVEAHILRHRLYLAASSSVGHQHED